MLLKNTCENTQDMYNHEAQPSRGTKRKRDQEQKMTKQTPHMKQPTQKQKITATEEPLGMMGMKTTWWLKPVFTRAKSHPYF